MQSPPLSLSLHHTLNATVTMCPFTLYHVTSTYTCRHSFKNIVLLKFTRRPTNVFAHEICAGVSLKLASSIFSDACLSHAMQIAHIISWHHMALLLASSSPLLSPWDCFMWLKALDCSIQCNNPSRMHRLSPVFQSRLNYECVIFVYEWSG